VTAIRNAKIGLTIVLVALLAAGLVVSQRQADGKSRVYVIAYFDNSTGLFPGDEVRIVGVPVGKIDTIEAQPQRVKITFWFDDNYKVPADAKAVILSPTLVTARAIQLTPAYDGGPAMRSHGVIPQTRTAVPMEFDDFRQQLQRLTQTLQPTQTGGVSPLGSFINTAADNLRGRGSDIRQTIIDLSKALSVIGDHSNDIFGTVRNLSVLVAALQSSTALMESLNRNLATVTALLANDPGEVGTATKDLNDAVNNVQSFIADNRETLGTTFDKLTAVTTTLNNSKDDIKQVLHLLPTTASNVVNLWRPGQGALASALALTNFANPISFLCGAVQAASRLNYEQSAKLCVQYLAPIIKNRQYNFPPLGLNPIVGAIARPNELTYSEDWMRPDYVPAPGSTPAGPALPAEAPAPPANDTTLDQQSPPVATDPAAGLPGMMVPPGGAP
jgi:phospholipid/cholesterol/gamma-HCH transport system substrate-binding protein